MCKLQMFSKECLKDNNKYTANVTKAGLDGADINSENKYIY